MKRIVEGSNKRFGTRIVEDAFIQEFSYVTKDGIRNKQGTLGAHAHVWPCRYALNGAGADACAPAVSAARARATSWKTSVLAGSSGLCRMAS